MDRQVAFAGMARAAPGVDRKSQPAFDRLGAARSAFTTWTPQLLPFDHLGGLEQFLAVNAFASASQSEILQEKLQRIHLQLSGHVIERRHRDQTSLRMVRRAPSPLWAGVGFDDVENLFPVLDFENVWQVADKIKVSGAARGPSL